jgi:hypothetical protein
LIDNPIVRHPIEVCPELPMWSSASLQRVQEPAVGLGDAIFCQLAIAEQSNRIAEQLGAVAGVDFTQGPFIQASGAREQGLVINVCVHVLRR